MVEQFLILLRRLEHSILGFVYREVTGRVIIIIDIVMQFAKRGEVKAHALLSTES